MEYKGDKKQPIDQSQDVLKRELVNGFRCCLSEDETYYVVTNYFGISTDVEIPSEYKGKPVKCIGNGLFRSVGKLTSIVIPDSVINIGAFAFNDCETSVCQYDNAYYFGSETNPYAILIKSINKEISECIIHPDTNFIYSCAFMGCMNIRSIQIPDKVRSIGISAFSWCDELKCIKIGAGLVNIDYSAFERCSGLNEVEITDIDKWCNILFGNYTANPLCFANEFYVNGQLIYKSNEKSRKSILYDEDSSKRFEEAIKRYRNDNREKNEGGNSNSSNSKIQTDGIIKYMLAANKTHYIVVGRCGDEADVVIPAEYNNKPVKGIAIDAFRSDKNMQCLTLPDSMKFIGNGAFVGCDNLQSVMFGSGLLGIGDSAFACCSKLTDLTIPDSVVSIGEYSFYLCSNLKNVHLPNGLIQLGRSAFALCRNIEEINIPEKIWNICNRTFIGCRGVKNLIIPDSVTNIEDSAFAGCFRLETLTLGKGVISIGEDAFEQCENLKTVHIKDLSQWQHLSFGNEKSNPMFYAKELYLNGKLVKK